MKKLLTLTLFFYATLSWAQEGIQFMNKEVAYYVSSMKSSDFTYLVWDRNHNGGGLFTSADRPMFFYWDNDDNQLGYLIDTRNMVNLKANFSSLNVGGKGIFNNGITLNSGSTEFPTLKVSAISDQAPFGGSAVVWLENAGGTQEQPTAVLDGNALGVITFAGFDGSEYFQSGRISLSSTGDFTATSHPSKMTFAVGPWEMGNPRMTIDGQTGNIGIGNFTDIVPESRFHVLVDEVGQRTQFGIGLIEAEDAQLDLISSSADKWGSGINFIEGNGASNQDIWSIARQTTNGSGNSSLNFNFGTTNKHSNPTLVSFSSIGTVGIGAEASTSPLTILGVEDTSIPDLQIIANDALIRLGDNSAGPHGLTFGDWGPEGMQFVYRTTPNTLSIEKTNDGTDGEDLFSIDYDTEYGYIKGNFGIGDANPNAKLSIKGDATSAGSAAISFSRLGSGMSIGLGITNNLHIGNSWNPESGTYVTIQDGTGNVGIGTINPNSKLSIYGTSSEGWNSGIELNREDGGQGQIVVDNQGMKFKTTINGDNFYFRNNNNATNMFIGSVGSVGIGTTTPSNAQSWSKVLDVRGVANSKILATTENEEHKMGLFSHSNWHGGGGFVGTESNHNLHIITNYTPRITLTKDGKVGIGLSIPEEMHAKLSVDGDIRSTKVKVMENIAVPDYVFEADYDLASLEEVDAYVKEYKHLPEIPSAADIEKDGLDLGEMNLLLLKKVEELTLHIIAQNKRIEKLEKSTAK